MSDHATAPSGYHLPDRPAPVRPRSESPAIDAIGPGFVLTTSTAPIVHLSGARARLLGLSATEQRHVVLLTQGDARLTPAMHDALTTLGGVWVVHTEAGLRNAATGQRLARIEDAVPRARGGASRTGGADGDRGAGSRNRNGEAEQPRLAKEHAAIAVDPGDVREVLVVNATVRHRNVSAAPFGASLRHLAEAVLGETALDWGVREPVVTPWDGDEVAEFFRARAHRGPSVVIAGSGEDGRLAVGQVRIRPRRVGAEEAYSLRVDLGPAGDAATTERWLAVTEALTELPEIGLPLYTSATADYGVSDLSIWPWLRPPSIPVSLLIGAAGVARFSIARRRAALEAHFAVEFVGSGRRPSLVAELGERPHPDNADELAALLGAIGADAVAAGLGEMMPVVMFGTEWRDVIAAAALNRLGPEVMADLGGDADEGGDGDGDNAGDEAGDDAGDETGVDTDDTDASTEQAASGQSVSEQEASDAL
ncbi:hypothetical protein GCM10011490_03010 [Pseudoclavibacter endophyticus]|uniref:Uncharacterized protein n=1 Tax=Pseudoclavibacter endophyticus TaxID=1778590 RepID=A0A6H9WGT2_9MICO|nr:DUF6177 family protein [Pseudoclavibacter endophyticus]KAB1650169.1 hypothetical protein F8O04_08205 [Pseudoclavibacter endophyticus]GGA56560.1 hypothetical protein GCM10011490_03010 [Pseudoclavibacter endophyticus]